MTALLEPYYGDCREILPLIPQADVVLTDIPYGAVNRESSGLRVFDKGDADDAAFDTRALSLTLAAAATGRIAVERLRQGVLL